VLTAGIGAGEWFVDGHDCLKITRSVEGVRGAMLQVLAWNPDELDAMRMRARRSVAREFGFTRWLKVIEGVCQEAIVSMEHGRRRPTLQSLESAYLYLGTMLRSRIGED
jgi:hypothetical protein